MKAQGEDAKTIVLREFTANTRSAAFLAKTDEERLEAIQRIKGFYPDMNDEIDRLYFNALLVKENADTVRQLRELFSTKQFQVANDLERQLIFDRLMKEPSVSEGPYRLPREAVERIAAQQTVKSIGSPFNVVQDAREVFRSKMFSSLSLADKEKYVELMLQQPSLVQANITRDDLLKAYWEIEANTAAINRVTADPLFLVMARLDPKSVLRTCETTQQFRRLCQNPVLFSALMRVHYPNSFEMANPKEQYIAITNGLETTYRMQRSKMSPDSIHVDWDQFDDPVQYGKTQAPYNIPGFRLNNLDRQEAALLLGPGYLPRSLAIIAKNLSGSTHLHIRVNDLLRYCTLSQEELGKLYEAGKLTPSMLEQGKPNDYNPDRKEIVFTVKGYPIFHGTKAWLLILESASMETFDKAQVFKTREDLADWFIQNEYPRLKKVLMDMFSYDESAEELDIHYYISNEEMDKIVLPSHQWKEYLEGLQLPYPFTLENVYKYLLENDHIRMDPESKHNSWLIRQVTF